MEKLTEYEKQALEGAKLLVFPFSSDKWFRPDGFPSWKLSPVKPGRVYAEAVRRPRYVAERLEAKGYFESHMTASWWFREYRVKEDAGAKVF